MISTLYKDYYWRFTHYIQPGARRIGLSRYTDAIEAVGMENRDGTIVVVALNRAEKPMPAVFRLHNQVAETVIPEKALCTLMIENEVRR